MMIPGIVAQRRAGGAAPTLWTPLSMSTVPPIYLDAEAGPVTESSGVVSAIGNLGALGASGDFSQSVSGKRPTLTTLGGKAALSFDGVDDVLECNTDAAKDIHRNVGHAWFFAVYLKRSTDASNTSRPIAVSWAGTIGVRAGMYAGHSASGAANRGWAIYSRVDGGGVTNDSLTLSAVTTAALLSGQFRFSSGNLLGHLNGTESKNASLGIGGFTSNTRAAYAVSVGATILGPYADIDLAAILIGNTDLTSTDRQKIEGWAAHKYGLTANLPSGHPYKTVAPTV